MERRNITLSLPKEVIKAARHIAVERGTSLSGLLTGYLEHIVRKDDAYQEARARFRERLKKGFNLGTKGHVSWTREEVHER